MRDGAPALARRIGPFDATMIVMGGIVGSGIFVTPAIVARSAGSPLLIVTAWLIGGAAALLGAFVYAELSSARPEIGGQYAYLREALHPLVAFLYGWALLLVIQTGGMAATAITFARYFRELVPLAIGDGALAALAMAVLTLINCFGVRAGSSAQSVLMVLKIGALTGLIAAGLLLGRPAGTSAAVANGSLLGFGAALIPVLFAYGGWQTSCFVAGEMRDPRRDLPRALLAGVGGVIALYTLVAIGCLRTLGSEELARTGVPALEVMTRALGRQGAVAISAGIAVSTLGFLSQSILTAPRVYFAMAEDGVFFHRVATVHPRTRAPVVAIALQGILTIAIALSGTFEVILNYVVSIDFVFFALTAYCVFVFRRRGVRGPFAMPGHPFTTAAFILVCAAVVASTFRADPLHSLAGLAFTLAGIPAFLLWRSRRAAATSPRPAPPAPPR
ncbi:MAG TPA: amino acid permease [Myxococcales bacterium]|jgi:APA family basic amino acid/polyamine antiporter|nr:amino acid permease [Myxococcales bacterium]